MIFMKYYNHNEMKKGVLALVSLFFFSAQFLSGQNQNRERLESYRIAFFTQRLKLTPSEAEKFWPLYNELQEERAKVQAERVKLFRLLNQGAETLSDRELTRMGDKVVELDVFDNNLTVKFHQYIKEMLPPIKVLRYYQAENQYKIQLLNQLQERREERLNPGQK
jgi:hypothetical protein